MAYFDNASTTYPKFDVVYDETMKIYRDLGVNFSRNKSAKSNSAEKIKKQLLENLKDLFSSKDHEVIINSSSTFSLNEIIEGLDYTNIKNVYISPFEHNSVYRAILKKKKEQNFDLEFIPFDGYELNESEMELKFLSKKPNLIILNHASNVFGNILPVEKIFEIGKTFHSVTVLDASQTSGLLDFKNISKNSDFIVFAGHKTLYGPSGIGGYLYNKKIKLEPLICGGTGIKSEDVEMPEDIPERLEAGSPNILGIIGLKLSTEELLKIGQKEIYRIKQLATDKLFEVLEDYDLDLKIISDKNNNIGIVSVTSENYSPQEFGILLSEHKVDIRTGMQCAPIAHKKMGTFPEGTVRFSVGYFTNEQDFDILKNALDDILY
ncbi:MAG: aminotransferase class V-fold PLP-dependent enzyme [Fusobacteriaceae bacterium]